MAAEIAFGWLFAGRYAKSICPKDAIPQLKSSPLLVVIKGVKRNQMQSQCCFLEGIGPIINPGNKIIDCAKAQNSWQTSISGDYGVVDLYNYFRSQLNH